MPDVSDTAKHLIISGRVQGVYYRYSMQQQATALGVTGWCRNLQTGEVEATVVGSTDQVVQMIDWCHQGPPNAQVTDVAITDVAVPTAEASNGFEIRG
ncbi:MAG: acylphosphatase [Vampirovibrio sp.]|nr:acylphosphatase [Vampirovibrio sp.]